MSNLKITLLGATWYQIASHTPQLAEETPPPPVVSQKRVNGRVDKPNSASSLSNVSSYSVQVAAFLA
jgi:hypothetical protein